ncbi:MAG: mitochondrial fission ELM1 family protein [Holosporales bacterium]|jgi:mitochondrial fission protein ELM1|nr:mitochondrial fission ELM1 family protein [Holosporales bacterium]
MPAKISTKDLSCWILVDAGKKGSENQAIGLAERLDWPFTLHRLDLPCLSSRKQRGAYVHKLEHSSPYPNIIISSGRRSQPIATTFKKRHPEVFLIALLNPLMPLSLFDLVIAPQHDRLRGPNVLSLRGVWHRVTREKLQEGVRQESFPQLRRPLLGVLLGGTSKHYNWTHTSAISLMAHCPPFLPPQPPRFRVLYETLLSFDKKGWGVVILPSRRTPSWLVRDLQRQTADTSILIDKGTGPVNPYLSVLAAADALLVTADSMSMISEACATGKPVYIFPLAGASRKLSALQQSFCDAGYARPFQGVIDFWTPPPLEEREIEEKIAERVMRFLSRH